MQEQIKTILKNINDQFTFKKNYDNKEITVFKDDTTEIMKDEFRDFIHDTLFMPDDYRYDKAQRIIENLLHHNFNDLDELKDLGPEICDCLNDVDNYELSEWLNSNYLRQDYCNEAINLGMNTNGIFNIMQCGQYLELEELFYGVVQYIHCNLNKLNQN